METVIWKWKRSHKTKMVLYISYWGFLNADWEGDDYAPLWWPQITLKLSFRVSKKVLHFYYNLIRFHDWYCTFLSGFFCPNFPFRLMLFTIFWVNLFTHTNPVSISDLYLEFFIKWGRRLDYCRPRKSMKNNMWLLSNLAWGFECP